MSAVLPLLWEFPGGRARRGRERRRRRSKREVSFIVSACPVQAGKLMSFVSHPYERYVVELYLYEGPADRGRAQRRERPRLSLGC